MNACGNPDAWLAARQVAREDVPRVAVRRRARDAALVPPRTCIHDSTGMRRIA
jgi:hypothetical protein